MSYLHALPPRATGGFDTHGPVAGRDCADDADAAQSRSGKRKPVTERRLQTKEQEVLEIAAEYFLAHGYAGTSINAMARKSGISKESIYRYFNSKQHLFEAVIDREFSRYQERLERLELTPRMAEIRKALVMAGETILETITDDRTIAMRRLVFEEAGRVPGIGRHFWEIGPSRAYRNLERIFEEHLDESEFEPQVLGQHFVALLTHKVMLERACGVRGPLTPEQSRGLTEALVDDFLKAFLRW